VTGARTTRPFRIRFRFRREVVVTSTPNQPGPPPAGPPDPYQQPGYPQAQYPQQPEYAPQQPGYPQPGYPQPGFSQPGYPNAGAPGPFAPGPAPDQGTNGLSIAGLVLAFFLAPIGLILSIIGLIQARRRKQRGTILAVLGIVVSLAEIAVGVVVAVVLVNNVSTVIDPGCVKAKEVLLANGDLGGESADLNAVKAKIATVTTGLDAAITTAKHDNVRTTVKALRADYGQLQAAVTQQKEPAAGFQEKLTADANALDAICTIGGAQK
jgi:hypothetical protein